MNRFKSAVTGLVVVSGFVLTGAGCYEEVSPSQPTQTQAQPRPAGTDTTAGAPQPVQSSGSALGGAKRAATNIVNQAEEASKRTADEIDNANNP